MEPSVFAKAGPGNVRNEGENNEKGPPIHGGQHLA
jgi:hypothetical protein